mmetsp:Transcript_7509/g.11229  ORF Transcript_7509/g.11229 Transcript_7509/m.11229 type:complete len:278 (+) Transcript_7509:60-893(+)|eukprot:CAMPEP_0171463510 /NCGR_PEP_ID=MMETSP0945-20130129/7156_1 /TAXON_ID=109269 /ORGANISM="Vaucheria litorea, Strain CCMP2940" /LENGTH=277 /DNA_ID=CAMNT_0011990325 /DNA_START=49 /DNA_END=882 /DNA_ORIENTATION=-
MMHLRSLVVVLSLSLVDSFVASISSRPTTAVQASAQKQDLPINLINPEFYWGEEGYKSYVTQFKDNALVNRVYPIVDRVREKKLLTFTSEIGLLSALEDAGFTLSQAEELLPVIEESGLLSFMANNSGPLLNSAGFLAVEPAELVLPIVVYVIKGGAGLLNTVAAAAVLSELATVIATKSPVVSVIAGIPLLGMAYVSFVGAGIFSGLKSTNGSDKIKASSTKPLPKLVQPTLAKKVKAAAIQKDEKPKVSVTSQKPKVSAKKVSKSVAKLPMKRSA